jgi:transcriptional regulator with AAA-type ATPase domain
MNKLYVVCLMPVVEEVLAQASKKETDLSASIAELKKTRDLAYQWLQGQLGMKELIPQRIEAKKYQSSFQSYSELCLRDCEIGLLELTQAKNWESIKEALNWFFAAAEAVCMLRGNLREKAWNALMNHSPVDLK